MTTATAHLADSQHPWIGLASFTEGDREFFAGRGEEIDELIRLVRRDILMLLYGVSGLGKTSLLQAGLFPALRTEDCLPVPIRLDYREGAAPLSAQVLGAIIAAADAARVEAPKPCPEEMLWEYLHREGNHFWSSHNDLVHPRSPRCRAAENFRGLLSPNHSGLSCGRANLYRGQASHDDRLSR